MKNTKEISAKRFIYYSFLCVIILSLNACSKSAAKVYPGLVGTWTIPPHPEPCTGLVFDLQSNSKAAFYYSNMGETKEYNGKAKMHGDDLFIKGERVFTFVSIKDTVGYKANWLTFCGYDDTAGDSLMFDKILTTDWCVLYHFN